MMVDIIDTMEVQSHHTRNVGSCSPCQFSKYIIAQLNVYDILYKI